jgi:hypothetical protein
MLRSTHKYAGRPLGTQLIIKRTLFKCKMPNRFVGIIAYPCSKTLQQGRQVRKTIVHKLKDLNNFTRLRGPWFVHKASIA